MDALIDQFINLIGLDFIQLDAPIEPAVNGGKSNSVLR
jgi:hypothetical protein